MLKDEEIEDTSSDEYFHPDPIRAYAATLKIKNQESVNHPAHYQGNSIEVIDVIEDFKLGFHLGNAIKYILRAGKKGSREEDLNKAIWYIQREISNQETSGTNNEI